MKKIFYAFVLCAFALCGCSDDNTETPELKFYPGGEAAAFSADFSTGTIDFAVDGGFIEIAVDAAGDSWSVSSPAADWVTAETKSGKLVVAASANASTLSRSASFRVSTAYLSCDITVNQTGSTAASLEALPDELDFDKNGGSKEIEIATNQSVWDYTVETESEDDSWISVEKSRGKLTVTTLLNLNPEIREAVVTVVAGEGENTESKSVKVVQSGLAIAYVEVDGEPVYRTGCEADYAVIDVETNQAIGEFSGQPSWIKLQWVKGRMKLTIEENTAPDERTGTFTLTVGTDDNLASLDYTVIQEGAEPVTLSVDPVSLEFGPTMEKKTITVITNKDYKVLASVSWLDIKQKTDTRYEIIAYDNVETAPREGVVYVIAGPSNNEASAEIAVRQQAGTGETPNAMILVYGVDSKDTEIPLPLYSSSTQNVVVNIDWGDGTREFYNTKVTKETECISHTYASPGDYDVAIVGNVPSISTVNSITYKPVAAMLKAIKQWGNVGVESMSNAFQYCVNLQSVPSDDSGAFENMTKADYIFRGCSSLKEIPAGLFKYATKNTTFSYSFSDCEALSAIPEGLFANCPNVTDFSSVFMYDESVTSLPEDLFANCPLAVKFVNAFHSLSITSVPENLFANNPLADDLRNVFYNCSYLTDVPAGLLRNCTAATAVRYMFGSCKSLKEIPAGFFDGLAGVTDAGYIFSGCSSLTSVPAGLFDDMVVNTKFDYLFNGCSALESIPEGLFDNCPKVTTFAYAFKGCTSITAVPEGLFGSNSAVTTFADTFDGCTNLETIPQGLFDNCPSVTNFGKTFYDCRKLSAIPAGLFRNNPLATTFSSAFYQCYALTELPADMFPESVKTTTMTYVFQKCTGLSEVPEGLLDGLTAVTSMNSLFSGCTGLKSVPANLFDKNLKVKTFTQTFWGCTSLECESPYTEVNGVKYHLYDRDKTAVFVKPTGSKCFYNCKSLADYADIPEAWSTK